MILLLVILIVGGALVAYALIEKRINQKPCPACGARISMESPAGLVTVRVIVLSVCFSVRTNRDGNEPFESG